MSALASLVGSLATSRQNLTLAVFSGACSSSDVVHLEGDLESSLKGPSLLGSEPTSVSESMSLCG